MWHVSVHPPLCLNTHAYLHGYCIYLASITEIVTSFVEQISDLFSAISRSALTVFRKYAGCFGGGNGMLSFESMETTSGIVGLSAA